jgi:predicted transcriptional regulator
MATTEIKELSYTKEENIYILTPEEEQMIDEGEAELDAGLGIPAEQVHKEIREWLCGLRNTK